MTENSNLSSDVFDEKTSDQILRLAKDLGRLIISLEEHPCLNPGAYHRIASLRCDIISSIHNILAIYDVEVHS